jgi:transposase
VDARFAEIPEALWRRIKPLLPVHGPKPRGGRPRVSDRVVFRGIVYRLRTGCQWKALPAQFSSGSTCHARFQEWCSAGLFYKIFAEMVRFYDRRRGIQWNWASMDSAMVKARKGGTSSVQIRRIERRMESNVIYLPTAVVSLLPPKFPERTCTTNGS